MVNNQDLIAQARALTGQSSGVKMPYIPMLQVNNRGEVIQQGVGMPPITKPAAKCFNVTNKNEDGTYETAPFAESISPVLLKVRYQIVSKHNVEPGYYSREFNRFDEVFSVHDDKEGKELIKDNYYEIKKFFATGQKNKAGADMVSFDLIIIAYVNIDDTIYRIKIKPASRTEFFDYTQSFKENETYMAMKTNMNLTWEQSGAIGFWKINFTRGEAVDLKHQMDLFRGIEQYFAVQNQLRDEVKQSKEVEQGLPVIRVEQDDFFGNGPVMSDPDTFELNDEDKQRLEQIPF